MLYNKTKKETDFSRKAPQGKFRVICINTFNETDSDENLFPTLEEARQYIIGKNDGKKMYVYNDNGKRVFDNGKC